MQRQRSAPRLAASAATSTGVSGLERHARSEPVLARQCDQALDVLRDLDVEGDAVAAGRGDLGEVVSRVVDHEMTVELAAALVDRRRDRAEDDRPDRHRRNKMAVADVEVEDMGSGVQQLLDLLAQAREVGRVQRRLDLDVTHPLAPGHDAILGSQTRPATD